MAFPDLGGCRPSGSYAYAIRSQCLCCVLVSTLMDSIHGILCHTNFFIFSFLVCEMLCVAHVCMSGEVLQNRLQMAHNLKQLTDVAHTMTNTELDDLRLHVKVL